VSAAVSTARYGTGSLPPPNVICNYSGDPLTDEKDRQQSREVITSVLHDTNTHNDRRVSTTSVHPSFIHVSAIEQHGHAALTLSSTAYISRRALQCIMPVGM